MAPVFLMVIILSINSRHLRDQRRKASSFWKIWNGNPEDAVVVETSLSSDSSIFLVFGRSLVRAILHLLWAAAEPDVAVDGKSWGSSFDQNGYSRVVGALAGYEGR